MAIPFLLPSAVWRVIAFALILVTLPKWFAGVQPAVQLELRASVVVYRFHCVCHDYFLVEVFSCAEPVNSTLDTFIQKLRIFLRTVF